MKLCLGGILFLPLTLIASSINDFENIDKSCQDGNVESCSFLEDYFLRSNKSYAYLKYSYQLCHMGQKLSCDIFYPTLRDLFIILLASILLLFSLIVVDKLPLSKRLVFLRILIIWGLIHFLYPCFVVIIKLIGIYPGNVIADFLYYFLFLIPLAVYFLKKYSIQINFSKFISGSKSVVFLFLSLVILYKLISLNFLLELKSFVGPSYSKLMYADPYLDSLNFVTLVLLIPIFEELFYKGIIFNLLRIEIHNRILVLVSSTFIFLLSHGNLVQIAVNSGFAFLTFLFYSYRPKDIWPMILAHIISNVFPQLFYRNKYLNEFIRYKIQSNESVFSHLEILVMSTVFFGLVFVLIKKLNQRIREGSI